MKTNDSKNSVVAQSAAEQWREKQQKAEEEQRRKKEQERLEQEEEERRQKKREEERKRFEARRNIWNVINRNYVDTVFVRDDEDPCYPHAPIKVYRYVDQIPSDDILQNVCEYGDHSEIMAVIKGFTCDIPSDNTSTYHEGFCPSLQMPDYMKDLIAKRGDKEEIQALCAKQGFGAIGQDYLLARGNHKELMWYLERHGLLLQQQLKLINRGNLEEIRMHIKHHALAPELLDLLIAELKAGKTDNFYKFIAICDIPDTHQKALLEVMSSKEFYAYIELHGFWEHSLGDLIDLRSDEELMAYIKKHHYLGYRTEKLATHSRPLIEAYMAEKPHEGWISILTSVQKLDYDLLTEVFSKVPANGYLNPEELKTIQFFRNASHEELMAYMQNTTQICYKDQILAELFFRNNPEEFEYFLDHHVHRSGRK